MRETLKRDHGDWVRAVTPVGEGDGVLSGGWDYKIKLWKGGTLVHTHTGHRGTVRSIVMVGGARFLSASLDKTIILWSLGGGALQTYRGHTGCVYSVDVVGRGARCVSGSDDKTVRVWDVEGGAALRVLE